MHRKIMLAINILALSTAASAAQPGADQKAQMVWGGGADRIVDTFQNDAQVRPCGTSVLYMPVLNTISFNARSYSMSLRHDFFENGLFYGTGVVNREIQLSADGNTTSGSVHSTVYASGGSVIVDLCGEVVSRRL